MMKPFLLAAALFLAAAVAMPAQALSFQPRPVCTAANAETDECKIEASCGHLITKIRDVITQWWFLENELIRYEDGSYTEKQLRQQEQLRRLGRSEDRLRRRLAKCEAKALA